ncbi:MAG: prolyl oligopeptidase family serine peptidase [Candidatus Thorarchaeota archaeon]
MTSGYQFTRYLSIETSGGATWHPDGNKIAFVANSTGHYQVYTTEITRGVTHPRKQLTSESDRCTDPQYLSDGTLIFTRDRGGDENFQIGLFDEDDNLHWLTTDLGAKHRIGHISESYLYFSANIIDKARLDVYRWKIPLRKHEPELIFQPESGLPQVKGSSLYEDKILIVQFFGNMHHHLLLHNIEKGTTKDLIAPVSGDHPTRWEVVRWLDDEYILVNTDHDSDFKRLGILSTSGEFKPLDDLTEKIKFEIEGKFTHSKGSVWTYFIENQEGYNLIHRANFSRLGYSDFQTLPFPVKSAVLAGDARSWSNAFSLSKEESMLTITVCSGNQPYNVWILDIDDMYSWPANVGLTSGLDPADFVNPTLHRFDSFDGLSVPYFRFIPNGEMPEKGWPTLLIIHGGPESQARPDFNPVLQFYLSGGFAIITPNIRGSSGYGRRYLDLDNIEKRLDSIMDIRHLALHLKDNDKEIDGKRLAIIGGSYGGFAVLSAMTEHPDLWKAGVDIVGISNFVTFLQNTAAWRRSLREAEYGSLEHDMETLVKVSPIHKIDKIAAPLFIIQGDNDERVPLSESLQMHEKLKEKGLDVELLRFADEGHGLAKLKNKVKAYSTVIQWLKENV